MKTKTVPFKEALAKAKKYCANSERCIQQVKRKLTDRKVSDEDIEAVIDILKNESFIDEKRFARAFSEGKFNINGWGKVKIASHLKMLNINNENIKTGLNEISHDNYILKLKDLIKKKEKTLSNVDDKNKLKYKLYSYAKSKGYENEYIFQVINTILE